MMFFFSIHSVAFQGCGGQRTFMFEEIRDFDLENFNPTALILETVRQTSVRQTVTKIWIFRLYYKVEKWRGQKPTDEEKS